MSQGLAAGNCHFWAWEPLQGEMSSWIPGDVFPFGSSRQYWVNLFTTVEPTWLHFWDEEPSQGSSPTRRDVKEVVSRHRPKSVIMPFDQMPQAWDGLTGLALQLLMVTIWPADAKSLAP